MHIVSEQRYADRQVVDGDNPTTHCPLIIGTIRPTRLSSSSPVKSDGSSKATIALTTNTPAKPTISRSSFRCT